MRFFEQLAPASFALDSRGFVRAALPPRFAAEPAGGGTDEPLLVNGLAVAGDASRDESRAPLPRPSGTGLTPAMAQAPPRAAPGSSDETIAHVNALEMIPTSPGREAATDATAATAPPTRSARSALANGALTAAQGKLDAPRTSHFAVSTPPSTAPIIATARPPLRDRAVAQLTAPGRGEPTVVQVTIDRIDVRAPAARATPERPPAKPRRAPSQSLGDYLRGRDRANGGAQ
jgi:hypothetical protein